MDQSSTKEKVGPSSDILLSESEVGIIHVQTRTHYKDIMGSEIFCSNQSKVSAQSNHLYNISSQVWKLPRRIDVHFCNIVQRIQQQNYIQSYK